MRACGIVAEYNPFHNGHRYQIEETKKQFDGDVFVAVMSGNWVQRGEPAIIDKWARAKAAVENGIDLVIELPYIYATQSATQFAHGALTLLKEARIEALSFGSECANLNNLMEIAETSINPDHIQQILATGMSYPRSYSLLTTSMLPNDILAVSYLKELKDTKIKPILIPRTNAYLGDALEPISSAFAIRKALFEKQDVGIATPMARVLENAELHDWRAYYPYFKTLLLTTQPDRLHETFLIQEGIENHLIKQAKIADTYEEFIELATNWRYTASRIRRSMVQILHQIRKEDVTSLPPLQTLRILAFNEKGQAYLHELKKEEVSIANRFAQIPLPYRQMEYQSTLLYTSTSSKENREALLQKEISGPLRILNTYSKI
ncbi:MAG: nucleotidyltransferase family protein [Solobacterium sp.]|nr:nucleotidyltransferase family protein [Solobacterium sp.]